MPDIAARLVGATGWPARALALLTGMAIAAGQPPFEAWALAMAGLVLALILAAPRETARSAFATGFWVGTGFALFAMSWIVEPFFVNPLRHGWMAPFALGFMAAGFGLFWGAGFGLAAALSAPKGLARFLALCAGWTAVELLRSYLFTGLPWALVSLQWIDTPLYLWAAETGPHGLTLITLLLVACAGFAIAAGRIWPMAVAAVVFGTLWTGGTLLRSVSPDTEGAPAPVVRLIQPNAPQHQKWDPAWRDVFFQRQLALTAEPGAPDLVIWPEVAVTFALNWPDAPFDQINAAAGAAKVILGGQRIEDRQAFNSVLALDAGGGAIGLYDKHHLVPFGEYIPGGAIVRRLGLRGLAERAAFGFSPGAGAALMDLGPGLRLLPLICYEVIFPHEIRQAGQRPDFLLNLTNDAWFGSWTGPYQHLAQARARAIEFGLPLVRVANTGVSVVFTATGQPLGTLPLNQQGKSDVMLPAAFDATTYWRMGDKPVIYLVIVVLIALAGFHVRSAIDASGTRR